MPDNISETIIAMERNALLLWARGDPDGFLEISDPEVVYFDPFVAKRVDGLPALRTLYEQLRGKIQIDHFEMIDPRVQVSGGAAVLTFQFESRGAEGSMRWNTTEVYHQRAGCWRILHTHWSLPRPA